MTVNRKKRLESPTPTEHKVLTNSFYILNKQERVTSHMESCVQLKSERGTVVEILSLCSQSH